MQQLENQGGERTVKIDLLPAVNELFNNMKTESRAVVLKIDWKQFASKVVFSRNRLMH